MCCVTYRFFYSRSYQYRHHFIIACAIVEFLNNSLLLRFYSTASITFWQRYFNGSRPTFGYKAVEIETSHKSKKNKRFVIDEQEAAIVRKIFDLYLNGYLGQSYGEKQIAVHLNERGLTLRGKKWARNRVYEILSNPTYHGEFIFNKRDGKNRKNKPESE